MHLSQALLNYVNAYSSFDSAQFTTLHINGQVVGRIHHQLAVNPDFLDSFEGHLTQNERGFHLVGFETTNERTKFLNRIAKDTWCEKMGLIKRMFGEQRSAVVEPDKDPLLVMDRAASHFLGVEAPGVFLIAYERDPIHPYEISLWVAKRSKEVNRFPRKLDVFAGGGIVSGASVWETLCEETRTETRLPLELIELAEPAGKAFTIAPKDKLGSQGEPMWVYTLDLTDREALPTRLRMQMEDFREMLRQPIPGKDFSREVECFQLMSINEIKEAFETKEPEAKKFKDNIAPAYAVALISLGVISPSDPHYQQLRHRLNVQRIDKAGNVTRATPLFQQAVALSVDEKIPKISPPSSRRGSV